MTSPTLPAATGHPARASRAIGAMFFACFGGLWLGLGVHAEYPDSIAAPLLVAVLAAALLAVAYRVYKAHAPALQAQAQTPDNLRKSRMFNRINALQWGVIIVAALVMSNIGYGRWVLPMIILVVGLHFLPLARLFAYPPHYLTGAALILLACVYPFVAAHGPESNVGALGTGVLLWLSAAWAISPFSVARESQAHRAG